MKLLVLDHFFAQDIESLRQAAGADVDLRIVDYDLFRSEALRIFPPDVTGPLEPSPGPSSRSTGGGSRPKFGELLEDLFTREASSMPSWPPRTSSFTSAPRREACHRLGVPFFVAQKETTISELTMTADAERVRAFAPPIADHMTVCSERHREFRLRRGRRTAMTVTGQPRFDFYRRPERLPIRDADARPDVLFFSYLIDAYHPGGRDRAPGVGAPPSPDRARPLGAGPEGWRVS